MAGGAEKQRAKATTRIFDFDVIGVNVPEAIHFSFSYGQSDLQVERPNSGIASEAMRVKIFPHVKA